MITTATLTGSGLTAEHAALLARHVRVIEDRLENNLKLERYYRGKERIRQLGIALPPGMDQAIQTVVGWPEIAVDVLEERLNLEAFVLGDSDDDLGIGEIASQNHLYTESSQANLDALIYGVEFGAVSEGDDGEPHPLITFEPPTRMTAEWDARKRRLTSAASIIRDDDAQVSGATLFTEDQTITVTRDGARWIVKDVQDHNLGRLPVVRLTNRPRTGRQWGSSEITPAVMSATDMAVRTLLGAEVAREFYSSPQRYILGASEDAFQDAQGNRKTAWETYLGRFLALTADAHGNKPEVGQLAASSPAPYFDQVKGLAGMFAAAAAIPITYLGFHTQNPPGGDGIRASEARLVKRAERRQPTFGAPYCDLLRLAVMIRDGVRPEGPFLPQLAARWGDAATPTRAATADEVVKLVQAGILPPDSEVTWERLGFDKSIRDRLAADARRARAARTLEALRRQPADPAVDALADRRSDDGPSLDRD